MPADIRRCQKCGAPFLAHGNRVRCVVCAGQKCVICHAPARVYRCAECRAALAAAGHTGPTGPPAAGQKTRIAHYAERAAAGRDLFREGAV